MATAEKEQVREDRRADVPAADNPLAREYQQGLQPIQQQDQVSFDPASRGKTTDFNGKDCKVQPTADQFPILSAADKGNGCKYQKFGDGAKAAESGAESGADPSGEKEPPSYDTGDLYKKALPSTVRLEVTGRAGRDSDTGTGSGVIVGKEGTRLIIATDNHVVNPEFPGQKIEVTDRKATLPDGKKYPMRVEEANRHNDTAFVSVDVGADIDKYQPAKLAGSTTTSGDGVVVGYPNKAKSAYASPMRLDGEKKSIEIFKDKSNLLPGEDPERKLVWMRGQTREGNSGSGTYNSRGELIGVLEGGRKEANGHNVSYANPVLPADVDRVGRAMRGRQRW